MPLSTEAIKMKCAELQIALEQRQPNYISLLRTIHTEMLAQTELTYKLADEEIAIVIRGLEKLNQVEITEPKMKKPVGKKQGMLLNENDV